MQETIKGPDKLPKKKERKLKGSADIAKLTFLFIILKLTNTVDWSWWWITSPSWLFILLMAFESLYRVIKVQVKWDEADRVIDQLSNLTALQIPRQKNGKVIAGDCFQFDGGTWHYLGNSPNHDPNSDFYKGHFDGVVEFPPRP